MRRLLSIVAGLTLVAGTARAADPTEGVWLIETKTAQVKISPCASDSARLCGAIVWLQKPLGADGRPKRDEKNPDPQQRSKPLIGLLMIRDFHSAGPGRWEGGKIYDPKTGKTYASKMRVAPDGTLKVEGCVMMICKAQTWTRVN